MTTPPTTASGATASGPGGAGQGRPASPGAVPGPAAAGPVPAGAVPGPAAAGPAAAGKAAGPGTTAAGNAGRRARVKRPPRLAQLQLKRIDPWTVLKISLIVSVVMFFVWMIAVGVLYLFLGSMHVWENLNQVFQTLTITDTAAAGNALVTPKGVFTFAAIVGAINIILFTALSTIAAMIYNAAAGMAGGVEVTLGERDA